MNRSRRAIWENRVETKVYFSSLSKRVGLSGSCYYHAAQTLWFRGYKPFFLAKILWWKNQVCKFPQHLGIIPEMTVNPFFLSVKFPFTFTFGFFRCVYILILAVYFFFFNDELFSLLRKVLLPSIRLFLLNEFLFLLF